MEGTDPSIPYSYGFNSEEAHAIPVMCVMQTNLNFALCPANKNNWLYHISTAHVQRYSIHAKISVPLLKSFSRVLVCDFNEEDIALL